MQKRHRVPTIFSIYMVDVLCCALGCVILLWQVNYYEAQEQTARAEDQTARAEDKASRLEAALAELRNANLSVDSKSAENLALKNALEAAKKREVMVALMLQQSEEERAKQQKLALVFKNDYENAKKAEAELKKSKDELALLLDELKLDYKKLAQKNETTTTDLADKVKRSKELAAKMAALEEELERRNADALARSKKLEAEIASLTREGKEARTKLGMVDLRAKLLEQDLDRNRKDLLDTSKRFQEMVLAQELLSKRLSLSSKELDEARAIAAALKGDKLKLLRDAATVRMAAENRFAGITLTGNKVIFLVDMSGSMEYVEERVTDPDKWPLVCETVAKIMKSLPGLREFQVILFSDKARYPLGNEGRWIEYLPKSSAKDTMDVLKSVKPVGETNMYAAFNEAFRYRDSGLDTIYVFSDGLPTAGVGLPPNAANLSESQKTELLGKYLRTRLKTVWNRPAVNEARVRINTIGFFYESPDVGAFLWALAREHDGSFVGMSRP